MLAVDTEGALWFIERINYICRGTDGVWHGNPLISNWIVKVTSRKRILVG